MHQFIKTKQKNKSYCINDNPLFKPKKKKNSCRLKLSQMLKTQDIHWKHEKPNSINPIMNTMLIPRTQKKKEKLKSNSANS